MSKKVKIEIRVPSDARYKFSSPYMEHDSFIKYCSANNVYVSEATLEKYEKNRLLFPCVRLMYPRELVRRQFREEELGNIKKPNIPDEWLPLTEIEDCKTDSRLIGVEALYYMVENGHPYDRAIKEGNPFVFDPEKEKFKPWKRYDVIAGKIEGDSIPRSKAKHYYAPWKIFMVQELNKKNTDEHNRALGVKCRWGYLDKKLLPSVLEEFMPFFSAITSFKFRRNMLINRHYTPVDQKRIKWSDVQKRTKILGKELFSTHKYEDWIRFLRKLIELHESYIRDEKYLLSLEMKSYMASTCLFVNYSTDYELKRIGKDVSGKFIGKRDIGREKGVLVYPGRLEEIFADEEYDLENNVRRVFFENFERFNNLLAEEEKIREALFDELFDELKERHENEFLVTVGKMNKVLNNREILWRSKEHWSCIRDLAVNIEALGKEWFGVKTNIDGLFKKAFPKKYQALQRNTTGKISEADTGEEYIGKLKLLQRNKELPVDEKCGKHLLITRLTRNFSAHNKALSDNDLHNNLTLIYNALVSTLFVLYDKYTLQNDN